MRLALALRWFVPAVGVLVLLLVSWSARQHVGDWLLGPASPTLIKVCVLIIAVYYALFGAFVWVQRQRAEAEGPTYIEPRGWLTSPREDTADHVVIDLSKHQHQGPPTAPIPRIHSEELGLEVINDDE